MPTYLEKPTGLIVVFSRATESPRVVTSSTGQEALVVALRMLLADGSLQAGDVLTVSESGTPDHSADVAISRASHYS